MLVNSLFNATYSCIWKTLQDDGGVCEVFFVIVEFNNYFNKFFGFVLRVVTQLFRPSDLNCKNYF